MACIRKEFRVGAPAGKVWDAVRDVFAVHTRLAPGFVTDCRRDGEDRIVAFANGLVTRELIVDLDDAKRRLAYSARNERLVHHNASLQVYDDGLFGCTVVWLGDVLPHSAAGRLDAMMEEGVAAMRKALGSHSVPA